MSGRVVLRSRSALRLGGASHPIAGDVDDGAAGQNDPAEHDEAEHDRYCGDVSGDCPEELPYRSAIIIHGR
jgi:hypothetical protein